MRLAHACSSSSEPRVGKGDVGTPEERGPGAFVNFGGGPEWFLKDDGTLLAVNGTANGFCEGLKKMIRYLGEQERERAPKRGNSPKTYEGAFDDKGKFLFDNCSQYEIDAAAVFQRELWRDPNESESSSTRRAARKLGLPLKVAKEIELKTSALCMRAVNTRMHTLDDGPAP